jgi:hypothetical protein
MSCAVMRMVCAERRTLPSSIAPTFSLRAIVPMSLSWPLNEKADVRAATCSSLISASELSSSSVSPSEKYSCSLSPLKFTNGSTAIECGGGFHSGRRCRAAKGRIWMPDSQQVNQCRGDNDDYRDDREQDWL